jgi:hypothetical protein
MSLYSALSSRNDEPNFPATQRHQGTPFLPIGEHGVAAVRTAPKLILLREPRNTTQYPDRRIKALRVV